MITQAFTGAAGTGKTTRLLKELETHLEGCPLADGQRVLALTFMHGSRFRLMDRLSKSSARHRSDCVTFDRFAWELCSRWRSRLRANGVVLSHDDSNPDYDATCDAAGNLLGATDVVKWIKARFPIVLIDEFQDCAPVRLAIVQRLHGNMSLFVAADDFQNLSMTTESPATAWLKSIGVGEEMSAVHRTNAPELLAAAFALRGSSALQDGSAFRLISCPSASVAASFLSQTASGYSGKDVAILSASRPDKSPWVQKINALVAQKQYGRQKAGPFSIRWERDVTAQAAETLSALGLAGQNTANLSATSFSALGQGPIATQLIRWAEHQRCVLGQTSFAAGEVRARVIRYAQRVRSFQPYAQDGRRAMTIHQAKNREFPIVIVLWPFGVPGDADMARRWLYNAVTRAKKRVIVLVEDPKKARLKIPPFV